MYHETIISFQRPFLIIITCTSYKIQDYSREYESINRRCFAVAVRIKW